MIYGAVVVMRLRPEIMTAQAHRPPDLRPISVRMVKHDVLHALKKQISSQSNLNIRRYGGVVGKPSTTVSRKVCWSTGNNQAHFHTPTSCPRAEQLHLDLLTEVGAQRERAVIVQFLVTRPPHGIAHSLYFDLSSESQCFPICPLRQHKLHLPNLAR